MFILLLTADGKEEYIAKVEYRCLHISTNESEQGTTTINHYYVGCFETEEDARQWGIPQLVKVKSVFRNKEEAIAYCEENAIADYEIKIIEYYRDLIMIGRFA